VPASPRVPRPPSLGPTGLPARVLVVEDDAVLRGVLRRFLAKLGYEVAVAAGVPEAVALLERDRFEVVVTDLRLPTSSGVELMLVVRAHQPDARTILMSGDADLPTVALAVERGVDAVLLKPFDLEELRQQVEHSMERVVTGREVARERGLLEAHLRQRDAESRLWILRAARALAMAVEVKDAYTAGHARRVTVYSMSIAQVTGGIDLLRFPLAGDLHDVGKIGVPDSVLNKPSPLTLEETKRVEEHPMAGARILEPLIDDPMVIGVVRWHHERWDGRGYPDGLKGDAIPLAARVVAVADTLDAMTSARAYREPLPWANAVAEIRRCSGSQFDPAVVAAFEKALPILRSHYDQQRAGRSGG